MISSSKTAQGRSTIQGGASSIGVANHGAALALTILWHPDLDRVGDRVLIPAYTGLLSLSRFEPVFTPPGKSEGAPLGNEHLSRTPMSLLATGDGGAVLDLGESSTSVLLRGNRVQGRVQFSAAQVKRGVILELGGRVVLLLHALTANHLGDVPERTDRIVGESDAIRQTLWQIRKVADLDVTVLLRGENGSGKELVAHALHEASPRRAHPFLAVNMAAISSELAVSELFGFEPGSHSAAKGRQLGYVEQARGGTLFLDEIGEAPIDLQVKLLRFLETGEVPVLGAKVRKVDVRIIAATDADLEGKMAAGSFRTPLFHRLSTYEIAVPPLRARRDDIGRLLVRFLREEMERIGEGRRLSTPRPEEKPWLPASLVARLAELEWPGNVRELRNVVRKIVITSRGQDRVTLTPALEEIINKRPSEPPDPSSPRPDTEPPASPAPAELAKEPAPRVKPAAPRRVPLAVTEEELTRAGRETRWNIAAAARQLGIARPSVYNVIERFEKTPAQPVTYPAFMQAYQDCERDRTRMAERLGISEWAVAERMRKLELDDDDK